MLKIAICDDKQEHSEYIKTKTEQLLKQDIIREIDCYTSADELLKTVCDNTDFVDIAVLDIEIGTENGIDLAKKLLKINSNIQIIFISGYYHYFQEVYYVKHISFVAKPINDEIYSNALNMAIDNINDIKTHKPLTITSNQSIRVINQNSIISIERQKRKSIIHLFNEPPAECADKLDALFSKLNSSEFFRCHESYIINLSFIKEYSTHKVRMIDDSEVPVSRKYKDSLKEKFHNYIFKITFK